MFLIGLIIILSGDKKDVINGLTSAGVEQPRVLTKSDISTNPELTSGIVEGGAEVLSERAVSDDSLKIMAVGDIMLDRKVRLRVEENGADYPIAKLIPAEAELFNQVDVFIGNLEGAISARRAPVKTYDFAFDDTATDLLRKLKITAVSLANNHSLDQGSAGLNASINALTAANIGYFGVATGGLAKPWSEDIKGRKIAVLGYDVTVKSLDDESAHREIEIAAKENDIVIVYMHWGAEYQDRPTQSQRDLGRRLIDWGADAVIGSHPHVIEGMEIWNNRPIFWSLGNFIFDQDWSAKTQQGLILNLAFGQEKISVSFYPVSIIFSQPELMRGEEKNKVLQHISAISDLSAELKKDLMKGKMEWPLE